MKIIGILLLVILLSGCVNVVSKTRLEGIVMNSELLPLCGQEDRTIENTRNKIKHCKMGYLTTIKTNREDKKTVEITVQTTRIYEVGDILSINYYHHIGEF